MKHLAAIVVLAAAACATVIPHPTVMHAERAGVPLEKLEHGRSLFVARCGNCHAAPEPRSHTPAQWEQIMPEMYTDAHLDDAEAAEVLGFLKALSVDDTPVAAR